ncbi:MAG: flagella basal body P-ring formation protein FlgA [Anaerolineae bacterium]|uniref:SAF domain-containing protein n=1 Tax=Candidatus Flexifilum breve TaxID=3140694 RepID=UPI001AC15DEB|nr:flagella basal body P-ring formation protein FlgA [Chloroflexota bacterium]MBK9750679.1 flagella basal body P-ring formation protein FlgA [Chloroflexota bacterium]MBN8635053.1 flagella basal body P-ring formation protein FlgA [Anaerolineae bacterium]
MGRLRIFLIIAILIIVVAIVVVVVLPGLGGGTQVAQQPTPDPNAPIINEVQEDPAATPLPTATPIVFVDIVVAVQEIPRGMVIPPNAIQLRPWPQSVAPFNGVTNIDDVIGKRARTDIFREQPILSNMVVDDLTGAARVGSDAAAVLPEDLVAVAIPMDRLTGIAYAPQDGDRVDLIISLLFVDMDEDFQSILPNSLRLFRVTDEGIELLEPIEGRPDSTSLGSVIVAPSERQRPRLVTQRTVQDALVVHVGNFPYDGRFIGVPPTPTPVPSDNAEGENGTPPPPTPLPPRPDIITLGVTPQEAVVITWMIEARIPITLALRSASATARTATTEVTLDYVMGQYGITLPGKRPFSIEPAIRSIRQLVTDGLISLSDGG